METFGEIIDLCDDKTVKSEATSDTVPLDQTRLASTTPLTKEEDEAKKCFTEQWIYGQSINSFDEESKAEMFSEYPVTNLVESSDMVNNISTTNVPKANNSSIITAPIQIDIHNVIENSGALVIPPEITDLVNKDCVIKFVNHLVIYAISRHSELELISKILTITPIIDQQINYSYKMGYQSVYNRCLVVFYEALIDITEILLQFTIPMQNIVILWLYNMVDNMCKSHSVDSSFLRNENYIEKLFLDFTKCQKQAPGSENMFSIVYQKTFPTSVSSASAPKKQRKPRTKKD